MTDFTLKLTHAGAVADAASKASGVPIAFTHMLIGDGGGSTPVFTGAETALVHQIASLTIASVTPSPGDATVLYIVAEYADPPTPAAPLPKGYSIREVAIATNVGVFYGVNSFPDTYLPLPAEGAARELTITLALKVGPATGSIILVNEAGPGATQVWVIENTKGPFARLLEGIATNSVAIWDLMRASGAHTSQLARHTLEIAWLRLKADAPPPPPPPPLVFDALLPGAGTAGSPKTARAATSALKGVGRVATDGEAASGVTDPGSSYLAPWITPEQHAASALVFDALLPGAGTAGSPKTARAATSALQGVGRVSTDAEAASGVTAAGSSYPAPWITPEQLARVLAGHDIVDRIEYDLSTPFLDAVIDLSAYDHVIVRGAFVGSSGSVAAQYTTSEEAGLFASGRAVYGGTGALRFDSTNAPVFFAPASQSWSTDKTCDAFSIIRAPGLHHFPTGAFGAAGDFTKWDRSFFDPNGDATFGRGNYLHISAFPTPSGGGGTIIGGTIAGKLSISATRKGALI